MKEFSNIHPFVLLVYYVLTIGFAMVIMNPVCLVVSLICAFIASVSLNGTKKAAFNLKYMLPILLVAAVVNPAFNHEGATILTYLAGGNPLTLESIAYGIAAGVMLISVICHFSCFNSVMTSDKLVYLFGRIAPSLSLVFSMTLRMVPRFIEQTKKVSVAQRCIGRDIHTGTLITRIKNGIAIVSIMITWSLENAVETADSMKSRAYGLKGRTAYSLFRFDSRDALLLIVILLLGAYIIGGYASGYIYWRWFPTIKGASVTLRSVSVYSAYALLVLICPAVNIVTRLRVNRLIKLTGKQVRA